MKKRIPLLLVAVLLLTMTACGVSQEAELLNKYGYIIQNLENGNYQAAIDQIEGMADQQAATGESADEPSLSAEQLSWQQKILGTWFASETATENGYTGFSLREDGTCTVNGSSYTWEMGNASETNASVVITEGETKKYSLSFSVNTDYGYKNASMSVYENENFANSISGSFFCEGDYTIVEIDSKNWQEYFEMTEILVGEKNAFDEVENVRCMTYLRLKDSHGKVNPWASYVAVEYSSVSLCQDITVDLEKMTYKPVGDKKNTSENNNTTKMSSSTDAHDNRYYGTTLGSFSLHDVNKSLTGTVWRPTDITIDRIQGTLYIVK